MPWNDSSKNITKVEFVTEVKPNYTAYWFYNFEKLNTIKSIKNLNTSNVTDMDSMFCHCSSLTSLDVSNFNTSKVTNMSSMFGGPGFLVAPKLTTIYVDSNKWSTKNVTNSDGMFNNCTKLKGQRGTVYSWDHVDASYAKVDGGTSNPGYLTQK